MAFFTTIKNNIHNTVDGLTSKVVSALTRRIADGDMILIEECLTGQEVSVFAFTDGKSISPLIAACDYKRAYDNDLGPNTGGMGSYSPPLFWNQELEREIRDTIVGPTIAALQKEGIEYTGVLYSGIMLTRNGPKVIEFNCRLGDPEAQVILPRLSTDLMEIILAVTNRNLHETTIAWQETVSYTHLTLPTNREV